MRIMGNSNERRIYKETKNGRQSIHAIIYGSISEEGWLHYYLLFIILIICQCNFDVKVSFYFSLSLFCAEGDGIEIDGCVEYWVVYLHRYWNTLWPHPVAEWFFPFRKHRIKCRSPSIRFVGIRNELEVGRKLWKLRNITSACWCCKCGGRCFGIVFFMHVSFIPFFSFIFAFLFRCAVQSNEQSHDMTHFCRALFFFSFSYARSIALWIKKKYFRLSDCDRKW